MKTNFAAIALGFALAWTAALTSPAQAQPLNREIKAALDSPDVKKRLFDLNIDATPSTPEQSANLLNAEIRRGSEATVRAKMPAKIPAQ